MTGRKIDRIGVKKPGAYIPLHLDMYPLDAPGLPSPGEDFIHLANVLGPPAEVADNLHMLYRQALRVTGFEMPVTLKPGVRKSVAFIPGHIWGHNVLSYVTGKPIPVDGPHPATVMVIGKMPGRDEEANLRNFVGPSGQLLLECLQALHVEGISNWYITNLLKFQPPDRQAIRKSWIKDCLPLLHQELRLVRPRYILCLGADASKALLGQGFSVGNMEGRVIDYTFPLNIKPLEEGESLVMHKSLVMTVVHPASVVRSPDQRRTLERGLARFNLLQKGTRFDKAETDTQHYAIHTLEELKSLLVMIANDPEKRDNLYAIDAEWEGEHPNNAGSYVRLIQFAWKPKHAAAIVWYNDQGRPAFVDAQGNDARERAVEILNDFFSDKRIVGHFLVADLEWLEFIGLHAIKDGFEVDLYDQPFDDLSPAEREDYTQCGYKSGDIVPAFMLTRTRGGIDTGLMAHAIEETAQLGLETLAMRYTTAPRWDLPLNAWKEKHVKDRGIKMKDLEGYGKCPDDVLVPYGAYDADTTLRLAYTLFGYLDHDYEGNCCREGFWESMLATMPILEMHQTGFPVSQPRIDELTFTFMTAKAIQEEKIRSWAQWPDFNIRSLIQVREFLYGEHLNGKRDKDGRMVRVRPPEARTMALTPILDTSKPPMPWYQVVERGLTNERTPGTGKQILGVLAQDNPVQQPQIQLLRDHRFLDQVLKSILRPPTTDKQGNLLRDVDDLPLEHDNGGDSLYAGPDNLGNLIYDAGLASVICDDGRVRTHLYPTAETGRWRSARPNLQNISKRRDDDYLRILGKENYNHKLRSIFIPPPGCAIVEADYKSAELYGMAIMSGDPALLEHCRRNQLSEDDPDYYDIHSNIAVRAFGLSCSPTKKGLKSIGKVALRVGAKNVVFGVAYGRGAKAIALQCKEEGNPITVDEAQKIINMIFEMYPRLKPFFEEAQSRSREERWIVSCFGRHRRFPYTEDRTMQGEFERQAMNFSIQSMVASAVDRGLAYMRDYRDNTLKKPDLFRFVLQIHDAVLLAVPFKYVEYVAEHVLPYNMSDRVIINPTRLDGTPTGDGPFNLGVDVEVYNAWGEEFTREEAARVGLPDKYAA